MGQQMLLTARTQRMLYTLLSDYDRAIKQEKNRRGVLDFSDVRRYLLQLLIDEEGRPTDVADALSARYDAVYIDEYQDVDAVQDLIFATIGRGGKRFMVGDIKQSIYSFRGAEPSIFADYRKAFPQVKQTDCLPDDSNAGCCVFMSENFRCDRYVVDFTNRVCSHIFGACADSIGYQPEDNLVYSKDKDRPALPAEVVVLEMPPKAQRTPDPDPASALNPEAVFIASRIDAMIREETHLDGRPIRPRDVAVLMRGMTAAPDLVKALRACGINSSFSAADNVLSDPSAMMLINLLSVIDNPRDDVPLTGLLTTEGSPITLSDLILLRRPDKKTSLYDDILAALDEVGEEALSPILKGRLSTFISHLDRWRALSTTLPTDRLLRQLASEPCLGIDATSPAYLVLYDKALNYQASSFCGLYQFMQYLRRLLKDPSALSAAGLQASDDAVTILSIHKSKGLQFPIVFVCSCGVDFNSDDQHAPIMFDPVLGAAAKIYVPETAESRETVTRRAIAHRIKVRQTEEEMRLLYVALTRAQERLFVTARLPSTFDSAMAKACRPGVRTRHSILSTIRYIDWILPTLGGDNVIVQTVNRDDYRHITPLPASLLIQEPTEITVAREGEFYRNILERHRTFEDPHALLRTLPTKAAASKLRTAMLDHTWLAEEFGGESGENKDRAEDATVSTDTESAIRRRIELMHSDKRPFSELLEQGRTATPAERGTATHLFLQHCDMSRLSEVGMENEIERLVKAKFMPRRAADILNRRHLEAFCHSDVCRLAKEARRVWRELHFDRFVPYATLTQNEELSHRLEDYTLYVQGSIDLIIEDAQGELWLFDYKTDRLMSDDDRVVRAQLLEHHGDQLRIYTEAARELFGRRPDHVCIYSLPLGRSVELTEDL
jgi:ATP-dependent helicase/nuclease subunit A